MHRPPALPSDFVRAVAERLPHGRVLDVACGSGRNALFFLARGDRVIGIDRSLESLGDLRRATGSTSSLQLVQADLEQLPLPVGCFDVVLNVRYLQRSLAPALQRALRPGGMLVFETFLIEQLQRGHPRNPDFLLQPNELLHLFAGMRVLHYEEGLCRDGDRDAYLARLLAERV
jgi:tellurite methyltransferase